MIDTANGWALSSSCNVDSNEPCAYLVAATTTGGRTWSKPVRVGPLFAPTNGDAPRHIHFLDARHGFVWGGLVAYATSNGGKTWLTPAIHAYEYVSFAGRGGLAWAVTYPCKKGGGLNSTCIYQVRSSDDGGATWSLPYALPTTFAAPAATAFGDRGFLLTGGPSAGMLITVDGGKAWRPIGPQCAAGTFSELNATSDGGEIFKVCIADATDAVTMLRSGDGGRTWKAVGVSAATPLQGPLVLLTSPSLHTALAASNKSTLAITHDAGATWTVVGPPGMGFVSIGFGSATDGYAIDVLGNVWTTQDGGDHWRSPTA